MPEREIVIKTRLDPTGLEQFKRHLQDLKQRADSLTVGGGSGRAMPGGSGPGGAAWETPPGAGGSASFPGLGLGGSQPLYNLNTPEGVLQYYQQVLVPILPEIGALQRTVPADATAGGPGVSAVFPGMPRTAPSPAHVSRPATTAGAAPTERLNLSRQLLAQGVTVGELQQQGLPIPPEVQAVTTPGGSSPASAAARRSGGRGGSGHTFGGAVLNTAQRYLPFLSTAGAVAFAGEQVVGGITQGYQSQLAFSNISHSLGIAGSSVEAFRQQVTGAGAALTLSLTETAGAAQLLSQSLGGSLNANGLTGMVQAVGGMSLGLGISPSAGASLLANARNIGLVGTSPTSAGQFTALLAQMGVQGGMMGRQGLMGQALLSTLGPAASAMATPASALGSGYAGILTAMAATGNPMLQGQNGAALLQSMNSSLGSTAQSQMLMLAAAQQARGGSLPGGPGFAAFAQTLQAGGVGSLIPGTRTTLGQAVAQYIGSEGLTGASAGLMFENTFPGLTYPQAHTLLPLFSAANRLGVNLPSSLLTGNHTAAINLATQLADARTLSALRHAVAQSPYLASLPSPTGSLHAQAQYYIGAAAQHPRQSVESPSQHSSQWLAQMGQGFSDLFNVAGNVINPVMNTVWSGGPLTGILATLSMALGMGYAGARWGMPLIRGLGALPGRGASALRSLVPNDLSGLGDIGGVLGDTGAALLDAGLMPVAALYAGLQYRGVNAGTTARQAAIHHTSAQIAHHLRSVYGSDFGRSGGTLSAPGAAHAVAHHVAHHALTLAHASTSASFHPTMALATHHRLLEEHTKASAQAPTHVRDHTLVVAHQAQAQAERFQRMSIGSLTIDKLQINGVSGYGGGNSNATSPTSGAFSTSLHTGPILGAGGHAPASNTTLADWAQGVANNVTGASNVGNYGPVASRGLNAMAKADPALRPWLRAIQAAHRKYPSVPESLIASEIMQESSGLNNETSATGAKGLMQLEPGTAAQYGVKNVWNPAENIMGGTAFLASLLKEFHGNLMDTTAAYFAGPGNVASKGWGNWSGYADAVVHRMQRLQDDANLADKIGAAVAKHTGQHPEPQWVRPPITTVARH